VTYKTVAGRPPADPWQEGLEVHDWEAWLDDDGLRFAWIVDETGNRVGAVRWVQDEVTQVLGVGAPEPPPDASEYALMQVKPRVTHVYSFQPGLMELTQRQGLELVAQAIQLEGEIAAESVNDPDVTAFTSQHAETAGPLYDKIFRTKGGRRTVFQYFQQFETAGGYLLRYQGRPVGLYADRLNPTGEVAVVWLGVLPDVRRQGLGRRLLRAGLARRAAGGWTRAVVQVEADNAAALHLYETLGFRPQWTRFRAQVG
jgi:ribosomal protein S18 acetylase RimI-like enzyme